jgi:hypothetical protein
MAEYKPKLTLLSVQGATSIMLSLFPPVPDSDFTPNINVSHVNTADNSNWFDTYLNASQPPSSAIVWVGIVK